MTQRPVMTDLMALARHRARALRLPGHDAAMFLHRVALSDIQERLNEINKTFTSPAFVTSFPDIWPSLRPDAVFVPDDDLINLQPHAHDLVVHAMSLHWSNDPVGQLIQCRRALRPDGLCLCVLPGGRSLQELRASLAEAETGATGGISPRVLPMAEIRDLGGLMQRAGFALPVADSLVQSVEYASFDDLLADLRASGETNALAARLRYPTRRSVLVDAGRVYSHNFSTPEGRITATVELVFLTGWAPHESQQKPMRPGSAQQRLADALGVSEGPLPEGG